VLKCDDVSRLFEDYMAGLLPQSCSRMLESHIENCPNCAQLLLVEDQELDALLLSSWHLASPAPGFTDRVMQQVGEKSRASWVWWLVVCSGYISLWVLGALSIILRRNMPWVMDLAVHMVRLVRSVSHVIGTVLGAVQYYNFSTAGLIVVFGLAAMVFLGIGLISKEELA